MKRFVSHYLYIPTYGFLKQYVIEINSNGHVSTLYPLIEEAESIIWVPGVILLITPEQLSEMEKELQDSEKQTTFFKQEYIKTELPVEYNNMFDSELIAYRLYPFDFAKMQPSEGARLQPLDNFIF